MGIGSGIGGYQTQGPMDPAGTAEILIPLNIPTVRGNEDRIIVEASNAHEDSHKGSAMIELLNKRGFKLYTTQYEMEFDL